MMAHANFPMDVRNQLWTQAYNCATQLDIILPYEHNKEGTITPFKCWFKKEAPYTNYLHMFGDAVSVIIRLSIKNKAKDCGFTGTFVRYEFNHPPDTYQVWKPKMNHVILTQYVTYLKRMFFKKLNPGQELHITIIKLEEDNDVVPATTENVTEIDENVVQSTSTNEAEGREGGIARTNLQQTTAIDEPPQHRYGTRSSG